MKKNLLYAITLIMILFVPFTVALADGNGTVNGTRRTTRETSTNTTTATNTTKATSGEVIDGNITVAPLDSVSGANEKTIAFKPSKTDVAITTVKVKFAGGKALTDLKCTGNANWTVTSDKQASGELICTFKAKNTQKGASLELGKLSFNNRVDEEGFAEADCQLEVTLISATGDINPETGASLPYIIVLGGLALAAIAYYNSNKRTKLHKI